MKVEIFGPEIEDFSFEIKEIYNEFDELVDAARHPREIIKIKVPKKVFQNNIMRLKRV